MAKTRSKGKAPGGLVQGRAAEKKHLPPRTQLVQQEQVLSQLQSFELMKIVSTAVACALALDMESILTVV